MAKCNQLTPLPFNGLMLGWINYWVLLRSVLSNYWHYTLWHNHHFHWVNECESVCGCHNLIELWDADCCECHVIVLSCILYSWFSLMAHERFFTFLWVHSLWSIASVLNAFADKYWVVCKYWNVSNCSIGLVIKTVAYFHRYSLHMPPENIQHLWSYDLVVLHELNYCHHHRPHHYYLWLMFCTRVQLLRWLMQMPIKLTLSLPILLRLYTLPYWSNPQFLIFDIWVLWRLGLSTRAPKCQRLKMVG